MIETHTAENIRRLRELNTRIINNLDAVAPTGRGSQGMALSICETPAGFKRSRNGSPYRPQPDQNDDRRRRAVCVPSAGQ